MQRRADTIDALFTPIEWEETTGRVWFMEGGRLSGVNVRLGVTDGSASELLERPEPGAGRTATARRCGETIPTASRVAIVRISVAWTATTTAGPANGKVDRVVAGHWSAAGEERGFDELQQTDRAGAVAVRGVRAPGDREV